MKNHPALAWTGIFYPGLWNPAARRVLSKGRLMPVDSAEGYEAGISRAAARPVGTFAFFLKRLKQNGSKRHCKSEGFCVCSPTFPRVTSLAQSDVRVWGPEASRQALPR